MALAALAIAGGAAAVVVANQPKPAPPAPTNVAPSGGVLVKAPPSGSTITEALKSGSTMVVGTSTTTAKRAAILFGSQLGTRSKTGGLTKADIGWVAPVRPVSQTNPIDPALQQKLDEIAGYAAAAHQNLDQAAKDAGAKALNEELKLDPPLTGDETWEDIGKIAGGAAGLAALGWIPGGQVLGPMIGAYLGAELGSLISGSSEDIKKWFSSRWTDIEDWVKGTYNDVEDAVSDAIDYVGGWF